MNPQEKKELIEDSDVELCDHCLGRQFAQLGHGLENYERGYIVRNTSGDLSEEDFTRENIPEDLDAGGSCEYCTGVFEELDDLEQTLVKSLDRHEYSTFLIGIRPSAEMKNREEDLQDRFGVEFTEPIKTELSRLLGKRLEARTGKTVDFERPDVNPVLDLTEGRKTVELQVNSLLIYGQYNKYSREIPQTVWHCRNCRGSGCEQCDWTGKNYQTSIQEIIQEPFMKATQAIEAAFHGGGREDVDAKCLGKREFILELKEPLERHLDVQELENKVNSSTDKVEVYNMREAGKDEIERVKQSRTEKTYRAIVETGEKVQISENPDFTMLETELEQRTPNRVSHRRADKIRRRKVKRINLRQVDNRKLDVRIRAEAGTYIKEFISGDEGRTQPNLASELGTEAECVELDVLWVEKASEGNRL